MPLSKFFSKLSSKVQNRVFTALIAVIFTAGYNTFDKYLLRDKNYNLEIELKSKSIKLEELRADNMELQIELVKCQAEYNNSESSLNDIPLVAWKRSVQTDLVTYVNKAFVKDVLHPMGKDKFDMLYHSDESVFGKGYSDQYRVLFNQVKRTKEKQTMIVYSETKNGKIIRWKSTCYPIFLNNELYEIGGIAYKVE